MLEEASKAEREGESPLATGIQPAPRSALLQQEGDGTAADGPRHATAVALERRIDDLRRAEIAYEACQGTYAEQQAWSEDQNSLLSGARSDLGRARTNYTEALLARAWAEPPPRHDAELERRCAEYARCGRSKRINQTDEDACDAAEDAWSLSFEQSCNEDGCWPEVEPKAARHLGAKEETRAEQQLRAETLPKAERQPRAKEETWLEQQPGAETQPKAERPPGAKEEPGAEQEPKAETQPKTERQLVAVEDLGAQPISGAKKVATAKRQLGTVEQPRAEQQPAAMPKTVPAGRFWQTRESDSEEEEMADWKAGSPIEPREPARQAGEGGAALAVAAPDDEEVLAATNVEPAEPREPAEPAVAPPTESTQMSAEGDGMGGTHGPDAGQWPTTGHPLFLQGQGGTDWSLDATKLERLWNGGWTRYVPAWPPMFRGQDRDQGVADERHAGALAHRKWTNELDKLAMQYQNGVAPAETPNGVRTRGEPW